MAEHRKVQAGKRVKVATGVYRKPSGKYLATYVALVQGRRRVIQGVTRAQPFGVLFVAIGSEKIGHGSGARR